MKTNDDIYRRLNTNSRKILGAGIFSLVCTTVYSTVLLTRINQVYRFMRKRFGFEVIMVATAVFSSSIYAGTIIKKLGKIKRQA